MIKGLMLLKIKSKATFQAVLACQRASCSLTHEFGSGGPV